MKTLSTCSDRMTSTANGPTSASGRRADAAAQNHRLVRAAVLVENVGDRDRVWSRTVRPGMSVSRLARAKVVVPAEMAMAVPGCDK